MLARAFFVGLQLAMLAGFAIYIGIEGLNLIAKKEILSSMGMVLFMMFMFLAGSIGIELSKDIEATETETSTKP